jgi:phosphohistidine phosphatase
MCEMKELLLVRHGIAEGTPPATTDAARRLTAEGRAVTRRLALLLAGHDPHFGLLVHSPLVRAVETADVLASVLQAERRETLPLLVPEGSAEQALRWLAVQTASRMLVVGHEPSIGGILALALGCPPAALRVRRSGASLVRFDPTVRFEAGVLHWHLDPALLPA